MEIKDSKQQDLNSSDFRSAANQAMTPAWSMAADWWSSPLAIRSKQTEYLEKFKNELQDKYEHRLNNSVPINEFRSSIETMAGLVFKTDPKPDETETAIQELFSDIDLLGNSFWSWCLESFMKFMRDGNGHILIDAPVFNRDPNSPRPTIADRSNDRPWFVWYEAKQFLNQQEIQVNGRTVRSKITFETCTMEADGLYGEKPVTRHLVYSRGTINPETNQQSNATFEVLVEIDTPKGKEWVQDPNRPAGSLATVEIPLVSLADMLNDPPLLTLLMLNILHYNKTSDFDDWCQKACYPFQVLKFGTEAERDAFVKKHKDKTQAPGLAMMLWGEHSDAKFVEVAGTGMEIVKVRYQDIEQQMAKIGIGMFQPSMVAPRSATEVMDTAGQRESKLAKYAREFENAVEKALYIMGEIINAMKPKTVDLTDQAKSKLKLKMNYDRLTFPIEQIQFLSSLVDEGKLSLETFLDMLWMGLDMPQGTSAESELKKITAFNRVAEVDQLTGQPVVPEAPIDPSQTRGRVAPRPVKPPM
jgi:hypothetical protein